MDKPSWSMVVLAAAVAAVVFGGALGPQARAVEELPELPGPAARADAAGCLRDEAPRAALPSVVPPVGPPDAQVNASGTAAAGGAGTVAGDARGDPCEPAKRYSDAPRAASAAAINTPTTLNRR
jgi:hypothetical protein